jgi:hypothetical protein
VAAAASRGVGQLSLNQREAALRKRQVGSERVNLQLWDCSGDPKYQACLPALAKDCNGAIWHLLCVREDTSR